MVKTYFGHLYHGYTYQKTGEVIPQFGGELFAPDDILDTIRIDDEILKNDLLILSKYDFNTDVDVNILGHIFEHSLNEVDDVEAALRGEKLDKTKSKRKKDGVFYTPKYITKYIVDNTLGKLCTVKKAELKLDQDISIFDYQKTDGKLNEKGKDLLSRLENYKAWLLTLKVCDPACGSGAFLNQALSFFIDEHRLVDDIVAELTNTPLRLFDTDLQILENNIFGVDINEESVEIAKLSLWLRTAQPGRKLSNLSNNIKCGNSLIDDPKVAGDKAFNWKKEFPEVFDKGGFDVVIGNPPYGAKIGKEEQIFFFERFETAFYKLDTYTLFIEKGINILSSKGSISFIVPYTWLTIQQHIKLRQLILDKLEKIIDLPTKIFDDADLDTVILFAEKDNQNKEIEFGQIIDKSITISGKLNKSEIRKDEGLIINLNVNQTEKKIIEKIVDKSRPLNTLFNVSQGLIPYDKYRGHDEHTIENRIWHSSFKKDNTFKPELQGSELGRYTHSWQKKNWISYGNWLAAPREQKYFTSPRILIMEITRGNHYRIKSSFTDKEYYNTPSIINIIDSENDEAKLKYLLTLLNSRLITWYHIKVHPKANATTSIPKILVGDVRNIPITFPIQLDKKPFITKAELMLKINTELCSDSERFVKYFTSKNHLVKIPSKLEKWYDLDFADFIKELNKSIKAAKGTPLTKKDEFDWMELFEENKKKALDLKSQIDQTDKEIDSMVYELYGLTEEEIRIVDES
jgi:type I restriction-modification system DNA methylase subunit